MTREDKIKLAVIKGYHCDIENGKVYNSNGVEIKTTMKGYITISPMLDGIRHRIPAHQFIYYIVNGKIVEQIDHIDNNKLNNRIDNLIEVTNQQNSFNRKDTKGYYFRKDRNKFRSQIKIDNVVIHLGYFNTEEEARQTYLDAKKIYHVI